MTASNASSPATLSLARPDDMHLHLRDGEMLAAVLPHTARQFARAIVMPNLKPPVTTTAHAQAYRDRILAALPAGMAFEPLMTLYLTDNTSPDEIRRARESGLVHGVKLYPAGATIRPARRRIRTTASPISRSARRRSRRCRKPACRCSCTAR